MGDINPLAVLQNSESDPPSPAVAAEAHFPTAVAIQRPCNAGGTGHRARSALLQSSHLRVLRPFNPPRPNDHIGYLPRIHASAMEELEEIGIESIRDIPDDFDLTEIQRRAATCVQTGEPWFGPELSAELDKLEYPLRFVDFETINPCVSRFAGMRPYDQLPFQFSVHSQKEPGATPGTPGVSRLRYERSPTRVYLVTACHTGREGEHRRLFARSSGRGSPTLPLVS